MFIPENQTIDATVERLWNEAIEAQHKRMLTHATRPSLRFTDILAWLSLGQS